ncbi:MAG: hypothetical protein CVT62_04285 [Actinobacteria bacterium HGW-Actinobacteria-2]|nr:MAG: hypothetical protein CVT62_04285 [Actinobacteria bacterium HGW-Actinobacteria-2]
MIEFELPDLGMWIFVVPLTAIGCFLLWPHSRQRRQKWAEQWARQNLVRLTPEINDAVVTNATITGRVAGVAAILVAAIEAAMTLTSPDGDIPTPQLWTLVISFGALLTGVGVWRLQSPWLRPSATRAAHLRSTRLSDYVPPSLRWSARTAAALCLAAAVGVALLDPASVTTTAGLSTLIPAGIVVAAAIMAEWSGRIAAAHPQPARDAVELYAQDAWRAGIARQGFQGVAMWGGLVLGFTGTQIPGHAQLVGTITQLIGLSLMIGATLTTAALPPIEWTRKRLWPSLGPGEWVSAQAVTL